MTAEMILLVIVITAVLAVAVPLLVVRSALKCDRAKTYGYQSPKPRARWAIILLVLAAFIAIVQVITAFEERSLLQGVNESNAFSEPLLSKQIEIDTWQFENDLTQIVILAASALTFIRWINVTYPNLYTFGIEELHFSPNWTWAGFVIPVFNLWRPYQVAAEIWKGSDPNTRDLSGTVTCIVKWWWWSFLLPNGIILIMAIQFGQIVNAEQEFNSDLVLIAWNTSIIVAAGIAIWFIHALTSRQELKHHIETSLRLQPHVMAT